LVQPKLKLGSPDDPLEREADRMADQVVQRASVFLQKKCSACEEEELHRKSKADEGHVDVAVQNEINGAKGKGKSLDKSCSMKWVLAWAMILAM
jgi:hypothetical protein